MARELSIELVERHGRAYGSVKLNLDWYHIPNENYDPEIVREVISYLEISGTHIVPKPKKLPKELIELKAIGRFLSTDIYPYGCRIPEAANEIENHEFLDEVRRISLVTEDKFLEEIVRKASERPRVIKTHKDYHNIAILCH